MRQELNDGFYKTAQVPGRFYNGMLKAGGSGIMKVTDPAGAFIHIGLPAAVRDPVKPASSC